MTSKTWAAGTVIDSPWLQDVNDVVYKTLVDLRTSDCDLTGATDSYAAFLAAFTISDYVYVPSGATISLDTMWEPTAGQVLFIGPNAVVKRRSAASSTDPVIWMHYGKAVVMGAGASSRVITEKACPQGIFRLGSVDMTTPVGVLDFFFCGIRNLSIEGAFATEASQSYGQSGGSPDIGILINAPQIDTLGATVVGNQAAYFHTFDDLVIKKLNYGITLKGYANAMRGSNIHFERLGHPTLRGRALDFNGGGESCFVNCWHHFSPYSVGVYSRSTTANTITYSSIGNQILNFTSEPGNAGAAKMFDISAEAFTITGLNYCTTVPSWVGDHHISVISPSHGTADINVMSGRLVHTLKDSSAFGHIITMAAGQTGQPIIVKDSGGTTVFKVDPSGAVTAASAAITGSSLVSTGSISGVAITGTGTVSGLRLRATGAATGVVGTVTIGNTHGTTVGAAGGASALPATPLGYLDVFIEGTAAKIPYYN